MKILAPLWLLLALAISLSETRAQDSDMDGVAAIQQVMSFRMAWLANDAPFEVCGIAKSLRRGEGLIQDLEPWARQMLIRASACAGFDGVALVGSQREIVGVQSIEIGDSSATVHLYVRVPSYTHHEVYQLARRGPPGTVWRVQHVRIEPGIAI